MSGGRPLRVGLVGCGAVSRLFYAPALATLERERAVEVRALADPDPRALEELRARFPGATTLADADAAALAGPGLDLAIIASPPRFHAEHAVRALRAGIAVLCEKPMATSVAEAEAMVEAGEAVGRVLAVGMIRRFLPAAGVIRRILAENLLGPLERVSFAEGGDFRWPTRSPSFFQRASGGVLMDIGIHVLDLLGWWLGPPVELDYADDSMGGVEVNCRIRLRFAGGARAAVRLSRDWPQPNRCFLHFEKGWLAWSVREASEIRMGLHGAAHGLDAELREAVQTPREPALGTAGVSFEDAFGLQLRDVVAAVRGQRSPAVPGRDALDGLRLVERCYAGRQLLPMPWLDEAETAAARRLSGAP